MPCIVPTCGATVGTFELFPQHASLSERWLEAIHVGCGFKTVDDGILNRKEICHWHFSKPIGEVYQEPKIFCNGKTEKVEIDSCRLCLRFYPISDMVSKSGKLSGKNIKFIVSELLSIELQSNDLPELICTACLARLELLKSIQQDFMDADIKFKNLICIIRDSASQKVSPLLKVIMEQGQDCSNSELDDAFNENESSDEWIPPKTLENILVKKSGHGTKPKSNLTCGEGSTETKLTFKEIISRKCYICPVVLESSDDLAFHLIEKHANKEAIRCEECSRNFPTLSAYNKHLSRHDQTERPNKCSFCPIRFKIKRAMLLHENTQHSANHDITTFDEKIKPVVCETCGESFLYMRKLRYHVKQKHPSDKPTCKICEKTFTINSSLERHMLVHTNQKPYVCSKCNAPFRRLFDLKNHIQKVHEGKNPHVCVECNLDFNTYESLWSHRRYVHLKKSRPNLKSQDVQLKCKLCNEVVSKTSDLQLHISFAHPDESYPYFECSQCPQKYLRIQTLRWHKKLHTDKFVCKVCGKKFGSISALRVHTESVHEKRQVNCPICLTKTYTTQTALRKHMITHTKGKQYSCDFCGKSFHRKDNLRIHQRTHTGEKPFECSNCLKRFSDDGTFSKHKKRCQAVVSKKEGDVGVNAVLTNS